MCRRDDPWPKRPSAHGVAERPCHHATCVSLLLIGQLPAAKRVAVVALKPSVACVMLPLACPAQAQCTMEDKAAVSEARVARAVHEAVLALVVQHKALEQATDMLFGCARRCEHGPDAVAACAAYAVEQQKHSLVSLRGGACTHAAVHGIDTAVRCHLHASPPPLHPRPCLPPLTQAVTGAAPAPVAPRRRRASSRSLPA